jgi:hypothetical protein
MKNFKHTHPSFNRRDFIQLISYTSAGLALLNVSACSQKPSSLNSDNLIIGGYSHTNTQGERLKEYGVLALQAKDPSKHTQDNYQIVSDFSVPDEVHLATSYPNNKYILVCSRKPNASLLKYDLKGNKLAELTPLANQHFEGHAIFSLDEKFIYTTASDFDAGKGKLLKLNSHDLSLVEQFDTQGIGPHELVWQSEKHIAIANTGVLTHPDSGREILNKDSIQSNIVLFNSQSHKVDHSWQVPQLGLSARHLDRMNDGSLVIGCQYKKQDQRPPCIAFANFANKQPQDLVFADENNESLHWNMLGYSASIKAIPNSSQALISNPRGHLLTQWQQEAGKEAQQLIKQKKIEYNKGIKIHPKGEKAWVSQGAGRLLSWNMNSQSLQDGAINVKNNIWWANHLG